MDAETFRRICMSFDAWIVGFGLSRVLLELQLAESPWAYAVMMATILIDCYLLYRFFTKRHTISADAPAASLPASVPEIVASQKNGPAEKTDTFHDPFGPMGTFLGCLFGLAGIAMLIYTFAL
jgi:hypothetical protein